MRPLPLLLLLLSACSGKGETEEDVALAEGPTLTHSPPTDTLVEAGSVTLTVSAEDPDGVSTVTVYHRNLGETVWDSTPLERGDGDAWTGLVDELKAPGLEYYIKGVDGAADRATTYLPEEASTTPLALDVRPLTQAIPWTEDFETEEASASLFTLGWWAPSEAFTAYPWILSSARSASGLASAFHPRGYQDIGAIDDWLISPALDLSGVPSAMVRWTEQGATTVDMEGHALYLSTTSRDPADGTFVPVEAALPAPPEDAWGRSLAYDLSAWAGEPVVYLAWRYTGTDVSDDWYIDDVEVTALVADFSAELDWSPDPVHPGETADLTVSLVNATAASVEGLSATLSLPEGGGTFEADTVEVGSVAGLGSATAPFRLSLDPTLADNRYLPLWLDLTDGSETWSLSLQMTVGLPSTASLGFTLIEDASVSVVIGAGDPEAPLARYEVAAGAFIAGDYSLSADITDAFALLPPVAGPDRWWAVVSADGVGYTTAFTIEVGGVVYVGDSYLSFFDGYDATAYLPEPPEPVITASSTSPSTLSPGSEAALNLSLRNDGAASAGPVVASLRSDDADVTVTSGGPLSLTSDVWAAGASATVSGFGFTVASSHTDSTPVNLILDLDDGVDQWSLPVSVAVPWPYLRVTRVTIDDDGNDGILDVGESAELEIELVNAGDRSTSGLVSASLSVEPTSLASATVTAPSGSYGLMTVNTVRDEDGFELTVTGGNPGDNLDLLLTLTDSGTTYEARTSLFLGAPPWTMLTGFDDPLGDNLDAYDMDFVNGSWRVVGSEVELLLESDVPLDPSTLFIESWGVASSASYTYYRWVLQSGVTTMQGYDASGFSEIGAMEVEFPSATTVLLRWDTADMGLLSRSFSLVLAAGWCGPPEYYCDHFPDGWGYPYDAFSTGSWFNLSW